MRDVLSLSPDLVISYHGINENSWRVKNYPMVHPYQQQIFQVLSEPPPPNFLPNLITLVRRLVLRPSITVSYGAVSPLSDGQQWVRNVRLMHAVAQSEGMDYLSIIQPVMGVGSYPTLETVYQERLRRFGEEATAAYYQNIQEVYAYALEATQDYPYVIDFTEVFSDQDDDVYLIDGRHLTDKGNAIVAQAVFDLLLRSGRIEVSE